MANKKDNVVLGIVLTAAACYIASRLWKKRTHVNDLASKGKLAFKQGEYQGALDLLLNVENSDFEILKMISECFIKLGNSANALKYLKKCILLCKSNKTLGLEDILNKTFEIHSALGMNKEAFKDLFLISLINESSSKKDQANDFLLKISLNLAKNHKIEGMASPINYADFFDTLLFLKDLQDPAVVFINSKEFEKCYEYLKGSEEPFHRLLLGCFYFINGDLSSALEIFEKLNDQIAWILIKFIKAKKLTNSEIEELKERSLTEGDPTMLLYMSKIFEIIGEASYQHDALERCNAIQPNAPATSLSIILLIKQKNHEKAMALLKNALKEYPDCINLICISLEYSLLTKGVTNAVKTLEMAEKIFSEDPRLFLFKFMIGEVLGQPDITNLKKGILVDPKYFKLYVHLGNTCNSGEESAEAYRAALYSARTFDEIFTAYQLFIVVETQNALFGEYPELFTEKK